MKTLRRIFTRSWTEISTLFLPACLWLALTPSGLAQLAQTNLAVTVRHAPNLNGGVVEGSLQQLLGENLTLNGGFTMTGDLLVPGTPTLRVNGQPTFSGTIAGSGGTSPSGYQVTLNGNVFLRYLRTRTTPVSLPTMPAPPQPTGNRSVTINNASQSLGDPATLRNLTLNGNVGQFVIPPGTYGNFIANGGSGFTLGIAGATQPSTYNLQNLTLNGQCRLHVVGPVVLKVANGFTANGLVGATNNTTWLQLQIASGGFTLNGGCTVYGSVTAPAGTVIVNGNSCLIGSAQCDRLTLNGGGCIRTGSAPNQAPVANAQNLSVAEDGTLNVTLTGTDAEGAPLTHVVLSQPGHGTLTGTAPNLIYTPAANFNGSESFTFKVNDGQADSAAAAISITVTPINDAPTAQAQTASTPEDTALNITLSGSDVENGSLTFQVVLSPAHGTLSGTAPNLTYTSAANYNGPDSFTFTANDGTTNSDPATITLTVQPVNDAPLADDQSVTTDEDTGVTITLTGSDVENDPLAFTLVTQPTHGTLSGTPPTLTYTPATNYSGAESFTFTANDGQTNSSPVTVSITINPVNDAPTATPVTVNTLEDTPANVTLAGTDADGDTLTFQVVTQPAHGSLTGNAPNLTYTPAPNYYGSDSFTFSANDGQTNSTAAVVTIVLASVNDAPVVVGVSTTTDEETPVNVTLTGNDVDGDGLSFLVVTAPQHGSLSGTAPNLTYTPSTGFVGEDNFVFKANDGQVDSAAANFTITVRVVNRAPLVDAGLDLTNSSLQAIVAGVVSDDGLPTGSSVSSAWSKVSGPGTVTFGDASALSNTVSFSQSGLYVLRLTASDSQLQGSDDVLIVANSGPEVDAGTNQTAELGQNVVLRGVVTDDGLPLGGLEASWQLVSGPGQVMFNDVHSPETSVAINGAGTYVFRLTATDTLVTNSDDTVVTVTIANQPPLVSVGPRQLVVLPAAATLQAAVADDGLPADGLLSFLWTKVSGPGEATFANAAATNTTATFSLAGDYVLRLTANDSALTGYAELRVAVRTPTMNEPPMVSAGANKVIGLTNLAMLDGFVTDDGLPQGANFSVSWSMVSGPGTVTFQTPGVTNANATFSAIGAYVLRLTASDSQLSASNDVTVTVYPYNQPPVVDAGEDQTVTIPDPTLLSATGHPLDSRLELRTSLHSAPRWNNQIGQPGLTGPVDRKALSYADGVLYAGGDFGDGANVQGSPGMDAVRRWDGTNWSGLYSPEPTYPGGPAYGYLTVNHGAGIRLVARGKEVFVQSGFIRDLSNDGFNDFTARWNGSAWKKWEVQIAGGFLTYGQLLASSNLAYIANGMNFQPTNWAGGINTYPNLPVYRGVATWDGTNWGTVGSNGLNGQILSAALSPDNSKLYVGGFFYFPTPSGIATNVAVWNGTEWAPLGGGVFRAGQNIYGQPIDNTSVRAMAVDEAGNLYVGGAITRAGNLAVHNIARWDGTNWSALGTGPNEGMNSEVWALAIRGRDVFAGGPFTQAGGRSARRIARWDGELWWPLGDGSSNGVNAFVLSLAVSPRGIYVGGDFTEAGGLSANYVSFWEFPEEPKRAVQLTGHVEDDGLPNGQLSVQWQKVSGPGTATFANSNSALTAVTFDQLGSYVLRLSANDSEFTTLDEVTITVVGNQPPTVSAGADQVVSLGESPVLEGSVTDDGLPGSAPLAQQWIVASGPGIVHFENARDPRTAVRFSQPGTYVLRLSANDTQFTATDDVTVRVLQANSPPDVSASVNYPNWWDSRIIWPEAASLSGYVSDDGRPSNTVTFVWTQVSGPGAVAFTNANTLTPEARFPQAGTYVLRLTATDSQLTRSADVSVLVAPRDSTDPATVVYAGTDQKIALPGVANLYGVVLNDGPIEDLSIYWQGYGPGTVAFSNSSSLTTTASFSAPGVYTLVLYANEGWWFYSYDTLFVTVLPSPTVNQPPQVYAGPPRSVPLGVPVALHGTVLDDGLPGAQLSSVWTVDYGPGTAVIGNSNSPVTSVLFTNTGQYLLKLSASDSELSSEDWVYFTVFDPTYGNHPPVVDAGLPQTNAYPQTFTLAGFVSDDGLPAQNLSYFWSQVSGPVAAEFDDNYSTSSGVHFSYPGTYILRLSADDGQYGNSADVIITATNGGNLPPVVDAGPPRAIFLPTNTVDLAGVVADDGVPAGNPLSVEWSVVFAPGQVTFADSHSTNTTVTFDDAASVVPYYGATYVLRLTATDGEFTTSRDVRIAVADPGFGNFPPVVDAGPDASVTLPDSLPMQGAATDDTIPFYYFYPQWTQVSGPAPVTFDYVYDERTAAHFVAPGKYVLRLIASDGVLEASDDVIITVNPATNLPPVVSAGPPRTVPSTQSTIQLNGSVSDDDRPTGGSLTAAWSQISGPESVAFANAISPTTAATFPGLGTYVLRLVANDSVLSATNDTTITAFDPSRANQPPNVDAGTNFTITLPEGAHLNGFVSDDDLPGFGLDVYWYWVSGPGWPDFDNQSATNTIVRFHVPGEYRLRLVGYDGSLENDSDVIWTDINKGT